jgi:hypothetical protein
MSISLGVHRSIDPSGVMPQTARRRDPPLPTRANDSLIDAVVATLEEPLDALAIRRTAAPEHALSFVYDASREKMCNDRPWTTPRSDAIQQEAL